MGVLVLCYSNANFSPRLDISRMSYTQLATAICQTG